MNRIGKFSTLLFLALLLAACGGKDGCQPLRCPNGDGECRQPLKKIPYSPPGGGASVQLGTIGFLVMTITDVVRNTSQQVFERIIDDDSFQKSVRALMTLFIVIYGITIALGMAQPSAFELVVRVAKIAVIYFLLTSWTNFQEIVVSFFESLTNDLTTIVSSAVVSTAGVGADTEINALDVFNFIDEQVLGMLLSVRFASIILAIMTYGGVGVFIGLFLFATILSYLWSVVISVQIFIMASIARSLLYAISPIFLIFILFRQTSSLFDGWLKQLVNFSLQPVFLIGFMAFFNGVFFNYIDTMFKPGYEVCYTSKDSATSGQTHKLAAYGIFKKEPAQQDRNEQRTKVQLNEAVDIFTLLVVIMLAQLMSKMNQWAVQAAAQLSEGGISFNQTMQANTKFVQDATKKAGDAGRDLAGLETKK